MKKKLLIIVATHGDERIGPDAVALLGDRGLGKSFDCLIGNPKAFALKKRFFQADLNRSFPGKKYSKVYESRRAFELFEIAKKYQYVIDIHEASKGEGCYIIVARERLGRRFPVGWIDMDKLLLWPEPQGATSQLLDNLVELEFVVKRNRRKATWQAADILEKFILKMEGKNKVEARNIKKSVYRVYGKISESEARESWKELRDFQLAKYQGEEFYPLLVGQYLKYGIICYKMRKSSCF